MKERPILFSAPMVRALLDGTKTQTRRVVKPQPHPEASHVAGPYGGAGDFLWVRETWGYFDPDGSGQDYDADRNSEGKSGPCSNYRSEMMEKGSALRNYWRRRIAYAATWKAGKYGSGVDGPKRWRPSIHMPRWASRITLEVTDVRVERLQEISEADAIAEGVQRFDAIPIGPLSASLKYRNPDRWSAGNPATTDQCLGTAINAYGALWEQINGPGSWDANPWVWVVSFKKLEGA